MGTLGEQSPRQVLPPNDGRTEAAARGDVDVVRLLAGSLQSAHGDNRRDLIARGSRPGRGPPGATLSIGERRHTGHPPEFDSGYDRTILSNAAETYRPTPKTVCVIRLLSRA